MAVNENIYLVLSPRKVERMAKTMPVPKRGEIVVKVHVVARSEAFREPTLVREIVVTDPMDGMHIPDIDFSQPFITEAEVEMIRARRITAMREQLEKLGYTVSELPPADTMEEDQNG